MDHLVLSQTMYLQQKVKFTKITKENAKGEQDKSNTKCLSDLSSVKPTKGSTI